MKNCFTAWLWRNPPPTAPPSPTADQRNRSWDSPPNPLATSAPFPNLNRSIRPHLILTSPEFANQSCELPDSTWTVGRSRRNQIVIQDDSVFGDHCELLGHGVEVIVRERGSRNGRFVDGVRVKAQSGVRHGQRLRLGSVEARLEIEPPEDYDATAITALDGCRKIRRQCAQPATRATLFPIIFAPTEAGKVGPATQAVAAPPTAQLPVPAPTCIATSQTDPARPLRRWSWLVVGVIVSALLILWLRTK